ncbi:Leucine Rich repeats (2 copies) [Posidoniimonas corsicana]|uniref:Leucine Rich repeats (2 copies) n=1 Tax=Posidoniimonas corsicana TaxID=1938618 RepID=A0A5C5VCN2_9BACT|nr:hypothetical protein [Posidoniimonas corsicana]TWT36348.1 Leucine Rich repeats (2 copies) [Posidoniimonas corsicana]
MLLMTVTCLWTGRTAYLASRQSEAIKTISDARGIVGYQREQSVDENPNNRLRCSAPKWLINALGEDYFRTPISAEFASQVNRQEARGEICISSDVIRALGNLRTLQAIGLSRNKLIDDAALGPLSNLSQLHTVSLNNTGVTGSGLKHLKAVPLTYLELSHSPVTNDGIASIRSLRSLECLGLNNTLVSDLGLERIAQFTRLRELSLNNTDVTDVGLARLGQTTTLQFVSLKGTKVSAAGVGAFKAAFPSCRVAVDFGLGEVADENPLFPEGHLPTAAEIRDVLDTRGLSHALWTGPLGLSDPSTEFEIHCCPLGARPLLQLVKAMPQLERLCLYGSVAGDNLLAGLGRCKSLVCLTIHGSRLSDQGLAHLISLPCLRELDLSGQHFTDNSVRHLAALRNLRSLTLSETRLTDEGRQRLIDSLPLCQMSVH